MPNDKEENEKLSKLDSLSLNRDFVNENENDNDNDNEDENDRNRIWF